MNGPRRIQNNYRHSNLYCDAIVQVGRRRFSVHRVILTAEMRYFVEVFDQDPRWSIFRVPEESGVTEDAFEEVLNFAYTGNTDLARNNLTNISHAARVLDYPKLLDFIHDWLLERGRSIRQNRPFL